MQDNINNLLLNLHQSNSLLLKLSERSFLKLYLHSDESSRQIAQATENLEDYVKIFSLQAQISVAAWEEQSRLDHESDMMILLQKLDEARESDQKMLEALALKSEAQQEAIKTLQRTLDQMLTIQEKEYNTHHPMPPVTGTWEPTAYMDAEVFKINTANLPTENCLKVEPEVSAMSPVSSVVSPKAVVEPSGSERDPGRRPELLLLGSVWDAGMKSPGERGPHQEFFEKALDVLRRTSNGSEADLPDWTITNLEISHEEKISHEERINSGYFATIWRGRWQGMEVAIKELTPMADRELFKTEYNCCTSLVPRQSINEKR
ncbi:hypothetical protein IAR55_004526 [Kwoniella newhampshirensis]|uniref:Protein kinase domain-containing protein n=1 Tax=Kwoniella newhampshirensis TaxID=1651941 RepID=A0AAW0YJY2_9TREE